jgi:hypothetical protein
MKKLLSVIAICLVLGAALLLKVNHNPIKTADSSPPLPESVTADSNPPLPEGTQG